MFLEKIGHQSGAGFIYRGIRNKYPQLVSKYDLVYIMRHCEDITDLGFLNFGLPKWNLDERIKVVDVINKIFKDDPKPKSINYLIENIRKVRTMRREGFPVMMRQLGMRNYTPGYLGLKNRHEENLRDLYKNHDYIENYIKSLDTDTSIESISQYFEVDDNEELIEKIKTISGLRIVKDPFSEKRFVLKKSAEGRRISFYRSLKPIVKIILFNCSKPLTVEEIKYFCVSSPSKDRKKWYTQHKKLDATIIKIIKDDENYEILSNGSILFTGDMESNAELIEIKNEVIEYIESLDKKISIDKLYGLVSDLSDSLNTKDELKYLLETDERVEVEDKMVGPNCA